MLVVVTHLLWILGVALLCKHFYHAGYEDAGKAHTATQLPPHSPIQNDAE